MNIVSNNIRTAATTLYIRTVFILISTAATYTTHQQKQIQKEDPKKKFKMILC